MPVAIMSLILLAITILLAIADRLLVNYGECRITIHQEGAEKEFTVQGGGYLLASLTENGIEVSASCGGKGTCGYCKVKVLSGGGRILPTEEIFMSREEKINGVRLACQIKVKNDIEIYIPDLLATVRDMVKNELYDPKLRWKWTTTEQPTMLRGRAKLAAEDETKTGEIIERYRDTPGAIMPILQAINDTYNYLPEPILRYVSGELNMPLSEALRIATFYDAFSLEPRGKYIIRVCRGTACYTKGADGIISVFEDELGIKTGETTADMLFTLDVVRCLGCCGVAPALKVNEDVHGSMIREKVPELIEKYRGT